MAVLTGTVTESATGPEPSSLTAAVTAAVAPSGKVGAARQLTSGSVRSTDSVPVETSAVFPARSRAVPVTLPMPSWAVTSAGQEATSDVASSQSNVTAGRVTYQPLPPSGAAGLTEAETVG